MFSDNFERGDRAMVAMKAYGNGGGFSEEEGVIGINEVEIMGVPVTFARGYPFGDLIADMCHLMARLDIEPMAMIENGIEHYGADLIEQAWFNSDDWHDTMQDESNIGRAIEILNINHVPIEYHDGILVKVGLKDA